VEGEGGGGGGGGRGGGKTAPNEQNKRTKKKNKKKIKQKKGSTSGGPVPVKLIGNKIKIRKRTKQGYKRGWEKWRKNQDMRGQGQVGAVV